MESHSQIQSIPNLLQGALSRGSEALQHVVHNTDAHCTTQPFDTLCIAVFPEHAVAQLSDTQGCLAKLVTVQFCKVIYRADTQLNQANAGSATEHQLRETGLQGRQEKRLPKGQLNM